MSLLAYLNGPDWDPSVDGGALVAYPKATASRPAKPEEVAPTGGTLVLFNSRALEHEARPTLRLRWALVGWFMEGDDFETAGAEYRQKLSRIKQRAHRRKVQYSKQKKSLKKIKK